MERFLIFIKHRLPFFWSFIEEVNGLLFLLFYKNKLKKTVEPVFRKYAQTPYTYRILNRSEADALYNLISNQTHADLEYFNPHGFDLIAIKRQFMNRSFLMMGAFDDEQLIGYFFLRSSDKQKSFCWQIDR